MEGTEGRRDAGRAADGEGAPHALSTGAGKDATLALHRARASGLHVPLAFNIHEGDSGRVRFHGVRAEVVKAHAEALGLELLSGHTHPRDYEAVLRDLLERLRSRGAGGVVFGNIHLEDIRGWYEERTGAMGLRHVEPLWGEEPAEVVRELVALGYRAVVVSVDLERGDPSWLGRELDPGLIEEIEARGADPCGEHGEYHTFVRDGPEFRWPVPVRPGQELEKEGHRFLDLVLS